MSSVMSSPLRRTPARSSVPFKNSPSTILGSDPSALLPSEYVESVVFRASCPSVPLRLGDQLVEAVEVALLAHFLVVI